MPPAALAACDKRSKCRSPGQCCLQDPTGRPPSAPCVYPCHLLPAARTTQAGVDLRHCGQATTARKNRHAGLLVPASSPNSSRAVRLTATLRITFTHSTFVSSPPPLSSPLSLSPSRKRSPKQKLVVVLCVQPDRPCIISLEARDSHQ